MRLPPGAVRKVARPFIGEAVEFAEVSAPAQGVNNETYVVRLNGRGLVVKLRPRPGRNAKTSAQWPLYTRRLFGEVSNGAVSTLEDVSTLLERHGALRVPRVYGVDDSRSVVAAPYVVVELLDGKTLGWDVDRAGPAAARDLGEHLGRLHAATSGDGFGIFSNRSAFPLGQWWSRFAAAFDTLTHELACCSNAVALARPDLEHALERARASGEPDSSVLICLDQSPSHYIVDDGGGIAGMLDVEAHLWAPRAYELAMVELWVEDFDAVRAAYERHAPWPRTYGDVRGAYMLATWMEWAYCLHTIVHDDGRARGVEEQLVWLARAFRDDAMRRRLA